MHPVTDEGARGVTAYLPGKGEVRLSTFDLIAFKCYLYGPILLFL